MGNTVFSSYTLTPPVSSGLVFNTTKGVISGTYSGSTTAVQYQLTGTNDFGSVSTTFTLTYKPQSDANIQGLTACYYAQTNNGGLYNEEWYALNAAETCALLETLDLTDNYSQDNEHAWPGLDDRIESRFTAAITGYLNIGAAAEYTFTATAAQAFSLYFDDSTSPLIRFSGNNQQSKDAKITLTSGRHLIRIYFAVSSGTARLKLEYESQAASLPKTTIDKVVTFVGGRAPSYLEYDNIASFVGGSLDVARPRFTGSYVTAYSITPSLPTGLSLNSVSGVISGSSTMQYNGDFTLTATGPLGSLSKSVKVSIGGSPSTGISAKYYELQNYDRLCQSDVFASDRLTLLVNTVDENINHPELPTGSTWNNLPGDVFSRFYVQWKGYLHIDVSGDYAFQLSNRDGARLNINKQVVINNWGCLNDMTDKEGSMTFNKAGYYPIEVEFFSNNNDFGIILSYKTPNSDEFTVIPANKFSYVPEASFTYTTKKTHYFRNVPIIGNLPVFYGVNIQSASFAVAPDLPTGLQISATSGMISGSPSADAQEATYTITATAGSAVYTTTISIQVTYVQPPSNLQLKNASGQDVTELSTAQFSEMSYIQLSASNNPRAWRVQPDLPDGLYIDWRSRRIMGTPTVSLTQTSFTVSAINDGGSATKTFFLTITGCQYGRFVYSRLNGNSNISFRLSKNNVTVYEKSGVTAQTYGVTLCIAQDDYDYSFTCRNERDRYCAFTLQREDGIVYLSFYNRDGQTQTGSFEMVVKNKPTITLAETELTVAMRQEFTVDITTSGIHMPLVFSPELHKGVTYSSTWNRISGSISDQGVYVYTISAENEKGKATTTLTINVGTCKDNKNLIVLSRSYGRRRESMILKNMKDETLLEVSFSDAAWSETLCLANGDYQVTMRSSSGQWTVGQELLVKDSFEDMLASMLLDEDGEKTTQFTINYAILDRLSMKYTQSKVNSKWNTVDFNDNKWSDGMYMQFGNFTGNTVYFRKQFTVDNRNKYPIFAFDLEIYDGVVAYINGNEVVRRNMPEGEITYTTLAVSRYDSLIWRRSSVPTSALKNGVNVLAVELHRFDGVDTGIYFDMYASLISGTCMSRTDRGYGSDSQHNPNPRYAASNAFDSSGNSVWRDSNLPVYLQFNYNYDRFEYINKVIFRIAGRSVQNAPKKFDIMGMINNEKGDVLASVDDRNLFSSTGSTPEVYLSNSKAYNGYRIQISETNDNSNTASLAEMILYTCNIVYCPKEKGWSSIMTGETTYGSCPRNTFGEAVRRCSLNMFDPVWEEPDESNCLSIRPPSDSAYLDFKYMVSNCTMTTFNRYVRSRFIDIVRDILLAKKENINVFLEQDCSDSETVNVCFNVRVITDLRIADYVYEQITELQQSMSYLMYQGAPQGFPDGMYFVMAITPLLRKPTSKTAIVVVVVLVVLIIVGTGVMVYNIRNKKQNKKVRGGNVARRSTIESLQERAERNKKEKKNLLEEDA